MSLAGFATVLSLHLIKGPTPSGVITIYLSITIVVVTV